MSTEYLTKEELKTQLDDAKTELADAKTRLGDLKTEKDTAEKEFKDAYNADENKGLKRGEIMKQEDVAFFYEVYEEKKTAWQKESDKDNITKCLNTIADLDVQLKAFLPQPQPPQGVRGVSVLLCCSPRPFLVCFVSCFQCQ